MSYLNNINLAYFLVLLILFLNLFVPLGYSIWFLYLIPLILASRDRRLRSGIYGISFAASIAIIVGYFIAPPGIDPRVAAVNRGGQLLALWVVAFTLVKAKEAKEKARNAQIEQEKQLSQLEAVINNMTEGLVALDPAGNLVQLNPAARKCYGVETTPAASLSVEDFKRGFDVSTVDGIPIPFEQWPVGRVLDGESINAFEVKVRRKDTGKEWIASYGGSPVKDPDGHMILAILTFRDITEQKRIEQELKMSEERLNQAMLVAGVGVYDHDHVADEVYISPMLRNLICFPDDEAVTLPKLMDCFVPEDKEKMIAAVTRSHDPRGDGRYQLDDARIRLRDGSFRWVISKGQTFFKGENEQRKAAYTVGAVVDVTARKQVELELQKAKEELDLRVEERTRQLRRTYDELHTETKERLRTVEELRKKEQILIQQNRLAAMGEMIGNIAHQWRQPLNLLGILVQEVEVAYDLGQVDAGYLHKSTQKAMQVIKHMSATIDDFRDFFRTDKEKVVFRIAEVVSKTVTLIEASFKKHNVSVDISEEEEVKVEGYRNEFSQVILNLLMNARDAIQERKVTNPVIKVMIRREAGRSVTTVADNAGGIPAEIIDRIFDPYFTTKGPDKGTGIGLFMSKRIIENNMNGTLSVRNTDEGAEFTITI